MSEKCCNRVGVQSTHWEGCHEVHPSCAAFKAGREAGMREAATMLQSQARKCGTLRQGDPKGLRDMADAIIAAIGEGK